MSTVESSKESLIPQKGLLFDRVVRVGPDDYRLKISHRGEDGSYSKHLVSMNEIFQAAASGDLGSRFPFVHDSDLNLCHAFLATHGPLAHEAYRKNFRGKKVSILFDENLPYGLVPALTDELPNLSHVYLEGMDGFMDEFIFYRPQYLLKEEKLSERRKRKETKFIIISRDEDLTDLAREQWLARIRSVNQPEQVDFSDINVVFRVLDDSLTRVENADYYRNCARDIMKHAYSVQAASYVIGKGGVHVERGSSFNDLLQVVENSERVLRFKSGKTTRVDDRRAEVIRQSPYRRWRGGWPSSVEPACA